MIKLATKKPASSTFAFKFIKVYDGIGFKSYLKDDVLILASTFSTKSTVFKRFKNRITAHAAG